MSGWTILTLRGRPAEDYEHAVWNGRDPWDATSDIAASFEQDSRIRRWTTWSGHVYAYLNARRYAFGTAKRLLEDYSAMTRDAVVLGANNTSDIGEARYYPDADAEWVDAYRETQSDDGYYVGEVALSVMTARHGIIARDPFHNECGQLDDMYLDKGTPRESAFGELEAEQ